MGDTVVVGIPTYNNEDTIGSTLTMVLEQTRPPDRIIVCDQSTDETRDVIRSFADNDDGVAIEIIDQSGDGVADAYNQILLHAEEEYDYLFTIQTDLVVDDDWIAGHLKRHREHPEIGIVTGDWKGNEPTDREVTPDERPYWVGRNLSVKPGVLEAIDGWDSNFLRGEDWDMRIRLAGIGARSYACTDLGYEWQTEDPYITLSKAKRRPTSLSFLDKYGTWYLQFHPSHVVSDALCVGAVLSGAVALLSLPVLPPLSLLFGVLFGVSVLAFVLGHLALRGGVDESPVVGPIRKQLLNGISVLYAAYRLADENVDWNTTGFDPDKVPNYGF